MLTFKTTYLGPTNYRPSRIKVQPMDKGRCPALTFTYDHADECAHVAAFKKYIAACDVEHWKTSVWHVGDWDKGRIFVHDGETI